MEMVNYPSISNTVVDLAKKIGVKDSVNLSAPEKYLPAFFEQILLLREKLDKGLLEMNFSGEVKRQWQIFLTALEQGERKFLGVRRESVILTIFCSTEESFNNIRSWMQEFEQLLETLGNYLKFVCAPLFVELKNT